MDPSAFILRTSVLLMLLACVTWEAAVELELQHENVLVGEGFLLMCSTDKQGTLNWLKDGVSVRWEAYEQETYFQLMYECQEPEETAAEGQSGGESCERWRAMQDDRLILTDKWSSLLVVHAANLTDGGTYNCTLGQDSISSTEVHILEPPSHGPGEVSTEPPEP